MTRDARDRSVPLSGSPDELASLRELSDEIIQSSPSHARELGRVLTAFRATTRRQRERHRSSSPADGDAPVPTSPGSAPLAALGLTLLIVTLLAGLTAGTALLPPRAQYDIDRQVAMTISAIAACVALVAAAVGVALPGWGSPSTRVQAWKIHAIAPIAIVIGVLGSLFRAGEDIPDVGGAVWALWLVSQLVALAVTTLGTVVLRRRARSAGGPALSIPRDADAEYFVGITDARRWAAEQLERARDDDPTGTETLDGLWRAGVARLRADGTLSDRTAAGAARMTALQWRLELAAEPDQDGPAR